MILFSAGIRLAIAATQPESKVKPCEIIPIVAVRIATLCIFGGVAYIGVGGIAAGYLITPVSILHCFGPAASQKGIFIGKGFAHIIEVIGKQPAEADFKPQADVFIDIVFDPASKRKR